MDKIVCVGKNYLEHARELGDAIPEKPVLFIKPPSILRQARSMGDRVELRLPPGVGDAHHECEIVLRVLRDGYRMNLSEAREAIGAVTLGLDMTLRELQTGLKKQGHPWEKGKTFLDSAAVGPWVEVRKFPGYLDERFTFSLDGIVKQQAFGREMGMKPEECVAYASEYFPLKEGDLIFTGTPAGVGPVRAGQIAELKWGDRIRFETRWSNYSS